MVEEQRTNKMEYREQQKGLHYILYHGIMFQIMVTLSGGAFIIAFALLLGASNFLIGLLAAGPFLGNIFQIPAVLLVEKVRKRRLVSIVGFLIFCVWLPIFALIPLFFKAFGLSLLVAGIFLSGVAAAFSTCAWSSWMHDLVPDNIRGGYFSKRMAISLALAMPLSLAAGRFIDFWQVKFPDYAAVGYSILFLVAFAFGIAGIFALRATPDVPMRKSTQQISLREIIGVPLKDENFRRMLIFSAFWALAFNFAAPFFVVYMLKRIGFSLTTVIIFSVISQLFYLIFLRVWGVLSDKLSNKSVMQVSGSLLLGCIIAWPFTTLPEIYVATLPLLVIIHVLSGIALAGVFIASFNIAFKLAPPGDATKYLALNGALVSMGMAVGPILGGLLADILEKMELSLTFRWLISEKGWIAYLLNFRGLDFLFFVAFILGLYALRRLSLVKEKGEVKKRVVYYEFLSETRRTMRNISSLGGLAHLVYVPIYLRLQRRQRSK